MGWWSDRTRTRFGRRRPFMFVGCFFYGLLFILLFSPPAALVQGVHSAYQLYPQWNAVHLARVLHMNDSKDGPDAAWRTRGHDSKLRQAGRHVRAWDSWAKPHQRGISRTCSRTRKWVRPA
jgi:hypothetical protein